MKPRAAYLSDWSHGRQTNVTQWSFYRPQGKVMFSQVSVCPQSASWLLLILVTARSVCIPLECFLVPKYFHCIQWQKYFHYLKGLKPATSCVRDQDASTAPARQMWETGSLNRGQFMLQWFIRFPEFNEFTYFNERSAPFRKKSNKINILFTSNRWYMFFKWWNLKSSDFLSREYWNNSTLKLLK